MARLPLLAAVASLGLTLCAAADPHPFATINGGIGPQPVYTACGTAGAQPGAAGSAQRTALGCGTIQYTIDLNNPSAGATSLKLEADSQWYPIKDSQNTLLKDGFKEWKFDANMYVLCGASQPVVCVCAVRV